MATIVQDPITGSQDNRRVNAFLRGPIVAGQTAPRYALAVETDVRNGVLHQAVLSTLPSPRDARNNDFGVQQSGGFDATILATDLLPETYSADGLWDGYSLVSLYGENPTAFTRNLPIPVPDWEGKYVWTRANEFAPAAGCRRVENEIPVNTEDLTASGWTATNLTASTGSGFNGFPAKRFTLTGGNLAHTISRSAVVPANTSRWVSFAVDVTGLTTKVAVIEVLGIATPSYTWTGPQTITIAKNSALDAIVEILGDYKAVVYARVSAGAAARNVALYVGNYVNYNGDGQFFEATRVMVQPCDGESTNLPGEYVSRGILTTWPFHGFGVDGVVWKRGPVNATRVGNVIIRNGTGNELLREAWAYLPGRAGHYFSTPDSPANSITGDIDLRFDVCLPSYATGFTSWIISKALSDGQSSYDFGINVSGTMIFRYTSDGTYAGLRQADSTVAVPTLAGTRGRFRVTYNVTTGVVTFFTSTNFVDWVQLGSTVALTPGAIFNGTNSLLAGNNLSSTTLGRLYRIQVYNGINGTLAVDFDFNRFAAGATTAVMATGETVTLTTSGAGNVARIVEAFTEATQRPHYHTPPETNLLDVDIGSWNIVNTPSPAAATGPDGLSSAWTLTDNDPAAFGYSFRAVTCANDSVTRSSLFLVKQDVVSSRFAGATLLYTGGTTKGHRIHINTVTGAITVDGAFQAGSHSVDSTTLPGWFIIRMSLTNNSTGNTSFAIELFPALSTVAGTGTAAAQGTTTFAWPMLTASARAEVYTPPGSAARPASAITFPPSVINDAEGFAYVEHYVDYVDAAATDRVLVATSGNIPAATNAGAIFSTDGTTTATGGSVSVGLNRSLVAWSGATRQLYLNGVAQTEVAYDGGWNGGSGVYLGSKNGATSMQAGSLGAFKWGKKRPPITYLTRCNASRDLFSRGDFDYIRDNSKGTTWELELLSQLERRSNGAVIGSIEVTDTRRAVAKRVSVTKNKLSISFADIDTDALDRVYPANKYSKEEFTNIYEGHIGRVVPDCSPGTQLKVPMAFINTNGTTTWTFAICERRTGPTYTVNTVYRDGRIVSASEYTVSTATATSGLVVVTVVFAREQRDTSGQQYEFTADITVSGSREPSREIDRLLQKVGITTDAASVTAAITEDAARGFYIDAAYTSEVQLKVIIEYLLQVARCDLTKTGTGAWALVQDKARASSATLRERDSLIDIESVEEPMPPRAYELKYRPRAPGSNDWQFTATRTGTGTAETLRIQNPYIYDGTVADRLIDYISKRENTRRDAKLKVWGAMFDNGDVLTVDGVSCYSGTRDWLIRGVERPTDVNMLTARQYDATIYTYSAGTIPAGASSGYAPDYSQSTPAAPTALTYNAGASGTTISTDGVARSYMAYAVTPPTVNFARVVFEAIDPIGGITRVEGKRNGTVFEAVLTGLRPAVTHTVQAYAVNATGIQGAVVSESRASLGYAVAPNAPSGVSGQQVGALKLQYTFVASNSPNIDYYEYQITSNFGGSYGTAVRASGTPIEVGAGLAVGGSYGLRVRAVDSFGNASAYSGTYYTTVNAWVSNNNVTPNTLTLGRQNTVDYFFASSVAAGTNIDLAFLAGTYTPRITADFPADFTLRPASDVGGLGTAHIGVYNNAGVARTLYRYYKVLQ